MHLETAKKVIKEACLSSLGLKENARNAERVPVKVFGPVGAGKSSIVYQAMSEVFEDMGVTNWRFHRVNAGTEAPDDIAGSNFYDKENCRMIKMKPWWWPKEDEPYGVVFLDEIDQGDKAQQNACGPLIDERRAGPWVLPDGWIVIGAGNRKQDRAGTTTSPSQIKDRWLNCEIEITTEQTLSYFAKIGVHPKIRAFLARFGHEWLHKFDPDAEAFPTPRSWERTSTIMGWDLEPEEMIQAIAAKVGTGATAALTGFWKVFDHIPDPDELIADPMGATVPNEADTLYAICALLSTKATMDNLGAILQYCGRFESQTFTAMIVRDVRARFGNDLKRNPAYRQWIANGGGKELLV